MFNAVITIPVHCAPQVTESTLVRGTASLVVCSSPTVRLALPVQLVQSATLDLLLQVTEVANLVLASLLNFPTAYSAARTLFALFAQHLVTWLTREAEAANLATSSWLGA